jgi:DNA methylase
VINRRFADAILNTDPVSGLTHEFYRYPARFSPLFAREAISSFSKPGELVFDPFMGGGTTLVEAQALGRNAIGTDISSLAVFISESKCSVLGKRDIQVIKRWGESATNKMNAHGDVSRDIDWIHYQRNINCKSTWPIRKLLEQALENLSDLPTARQQRFVRCVLLRTGQWALDCRSHVPSAIEFRTQLGVFLGQMLTSACEYASKVQSAEQSVGRKINVTCLHRSAVGVESDDALSKVGKAPSLILTSPPYLGVHVLYHRWQIQGRRETPAPFWISGSLDGNGASFYTFGGRNARSAEKYFEQATAAFRSVAEVSDHKTTVVQMVAFSDPATQLPEYLEMLEDVGLTEKKASRFANTKDGRIWRSVPNRKWYAGQREQSGSSSEVVLFHRKKRRK